MSRYTGPIYKKSRRVAYSTLETGEELKRKPYRPGQHGQERQRKPSNYGIQLTEKQKIKFIYGLNERQLKKTFKNAGKMKGIHGENLLKLLESRLDNVVYRMGLTNTRRGSRQFVNHGHVLVNQKKVDIPSYQVKPGDIISLKEKAKNFIIIKSALENVSHTVAYVSFDQKKLEGIFIRYPDRSELDDNINESLVVEFYNR